MIALVAAWVLMLLPLPWSLGSGIAGIAALVLLVRMVILAWRDKRPGMALVSAIIGIPAVLTIVLSALMSAVFYGPMLELQECRASAITHQAQDACQESVEGSVVDWLEGLTGG